MKIKFAPKRFPMAVAVDEARQYGLARGIDCLRSSRDCDFASAADRLEPVAFDDNDGILDRRPASAVDQRSALDHKRLCVHRFGNAQYICCGEKPSSKSFEPGYFDDHTSSPLHGA